jgi:TATA-box binding protein (TBP) (component of TFIID and TFIIIB)
LWVQLHILSLIHHYKHHPHFLSMSYGYWVPPSDKVVEHEHVAIPTYKIHVHNVVAVGRVSVPINLRDFVLSTIDAGIDERTNRVEKRIKRPGKKPTTIGFAKVFASGQVYVVGCKTPQAARICIRRCARIVQKMYAKQDEDYNRPYLNEMIENIEKYPDYTDDIQAHYGKYFRARSVKLCNFRIVNYLCTTKLPFGVDLNSLYANHENVNYTDEQNYILFDKEFKVNGLKWYILSGDDKIVMTIQHTGSIVITRSTSLQMIRNCIDLVLPEIVKHTIPDFVKPKTQKLDVAVPYRFEELHYTNILDLTD